jgi:hypothetical protein
VDEWETKIRESYPDPENQYRREYEAALVYVRSIIDIKQPNAETNK